MAFIDYAGETEEERRKRLAEEAAAAATANEAVASGGGAVAPQSAFGQYLDRRLGAIGDRFDQVGQYFTDPEAALQRRLGMQAEAANTEVQTQTVKTYGDGSQEHIVKTQMPAPVAGPAVPEQMAPQAMAPVETTAPVVVAPTAPVAPEQAQQPQLHPAFAAAVQRPAPAQPVAPAIPAEMAQQPVAQPVLPTPGPGVQVASADAAAGLQAAAAARAQQQAQQVSAQAPAPTPSLQQQAVTAFAPTVEREILQPITQADRDQMAIVNARNEQDPVKRRQAFAQLLGREDVSEGNKALANKFIAEDYLKQLNIAKAEKQIAEGTPTDLARYMKEQKKEGSYVKAILLARLGLTDLAAKEQELLNPTVKAETAVVGDQKYTVFKDKNNNITEAFDINGKSVGQEDIAKIMAAAMPTKAFLMAQSHGAPVQKTIIGPDGQPQIVTGLMFSDPQRGNRTYVKVGDTEMSTEGWNTMAQTVQNVYGAAQAGAQGKAAGEGFKPGVPLPYPGTTPAPAGPVTPETTVTAPSLDLRRAQGDVAAIDREIAATKPNSPGAQQRLAILNQERAQAQQRVQQAGGAVQGLTATPAPAVSATAPVWQQRQQAAVGEAAAKEQIQVAGARSQSFNKILDEEVRPEAQKGDIISSTRKQQFAMFDRPGIDVNKLFGLYNAAQENPNDQKLSIVRDIFGGVFKPEAEVSQRLAQLNLTSQEKSALAEYNIANAKINAATLKQTAGPGSVSDAEQRANREANVDVTKIPALGAYNAMAQSQFSGDLSRYKADWAESSPASNALQLDKAWRKESASLSQVYGDIAKKRAEYIAANGATTAAVRDGYKKYPVPEYDPNTGTWKKTKPLADILGR